MDQVCTLAGGGPAHEFFAGSVAGLVTAFRSTADLPAEHKQAALADGIEAAIVMSVAGFFGILMLLVALAVESWRLRRDPGRAEVSG